MKKYYLIPITEYTIYVGDKSLRDILKINHKELVERENERINILYSTSPVVEMSPSEKLRYKKHNEETKRMYESLGVPEFVVAYKDDFFTKELITGTILTSPHSINFNIRETSNDKVLDYLEESNYTKKINDFLNGIKPEELYIEEYEADCYIEGTLNGKPVFGSFNGKVKVKIKENKKTTKKYELIK